MSQAGTPGSGEKIGEAFIELRATTDKLKADLQRGKAEAQQAVSTPIRGTPTGSKTGAVPQGGGGADKPAATVMAEVGRETEAVDRKARGVLRTLSSIRQAITRLIIPIAIVATVDRLAQSWKEAYRSLEEYRKGFEELRRQHGEFTASLAAELRLQKEVAAQLAVDRAQREEELKLIDAQTKKLEELDTLYGFLKNSAVELAKEFVSLWDSSSEGGKSYDGVVAAIKKSTADAIAESRRFAAQQKQILAAQAALIREQQRLERLIREQRGSDISKTAIDISRTSQYLDILQRQRAAEAGA